MHPKAPRSQDQPLAGGPCRASSRRCAGRHPVFAQTPQLQLVRVSARLSYRLPGRPSLAGERSLSTAARWPPPTPPAVMTTSASRLHRLSAATRSGFVLAATAAALSPLAASARPWPIPQPSWSGSVQDYPAPSAPPRPWWNPAATSGDQAYATPPLTPEQQIQRCNTGRLIGGLGGGAVAYAMSRNEGRAWAIPLGALLGSQVGCNAAAGRGPLPW